MKVDLLPLTSLMEGEEGIVYSISGGYGLISRLAAMGIAPGIWLKVLRNNRGPLLVITNGTRIAIGRGQASRIMITRVGDEKGGTGQ